MQPCQWLTFSRVFFNMAAVSRIILEALQSYQLMQIWPFFMFTAIEFSLTLITFVGPEGQISAGEKYLLHQLSLKSLCLINKNK